jgi:hypothetical protein
MSSTFTSGRIAKQIMIESKAFITDEPELRISKNAFINQFLEGTLYKILF